MSKNFQKQEILEASSPSSRICRIGGVLGGVPLWLLVWCKTSRLCSADPHPQQSKTARLKNASVHPLVLNCNTLKSQGAWTLCQNTWRTGAYRCCLRSYLRWWVLAPQTAVVCSRCLFLLIHASAPQSVMRKAP